MVNRVTLIGNLGRDPELRRLESGTAVAQFSIATNESYRDRDGQWRDQTEWHEIVLWRQLAERAETQLRKGMLVYVEGKLSTRKWQDRDGNDRKTTEVVASYLRILNRREGGDGGGAGGGYGGGSAQAGGSAAPAKPDAGGSVATSPPSGNAGAGAASAGDVAPAPGNNDADESDLPF